MKLSISEEILKKYGLKGVHPIADLFPLLVGADRDEFRESVRARGVVAPISVNPKSILLEGRNRLIIADELGVECPQVVVDEKDEAGWIIAMNVNRRHLDTSQRAMISAALANMPVGRNWNSNLANLPDKNISQSDAAKMMNVSPRAVSMASTVRKKAAPEVVEKVESGEMTLNAAHETVKKSEQPPEQVGGQETKLPSAVPSAEIDDQCRERIQKIVKLMQDLFLFLALDAARSNGAYQRLQNEIESIYSKAQKKKRARAAKLSQQKLDFSASTASSRQSFMTTKDKNGCPEMGADLSQQLYRWQAANILREQFPDANASILASAISEAFRDGWETCSHSKLVAIFEKREKEAK